MANESELFTNTKPVAVLTSTPNQTWFYNMEEVVFSSTNSYDPDQGDYINLTEFFINGSSIGTDTSSVNLCFALNGSPDGDCIELSAGVTTVTVGIRVKDNHGRWSTTVSTTYTIQQHKGRKYFITDHIGNVRATVNRDGNILGYDDYYPFGKVMQANNNANPNDNYKFTGHERDTEASLSIDYMNARTYDPITGIFMQRDPLEDQFPGWTPYHYVHNTPLNLVDPTGMSATEGANKSEEEREADNNRPQKAGVEVKGTGWGAVGANLIDGGGMIGMTRANRTDPEISEQHGYNSTVNEATETFDNYSEASGTFNTPTGSLFFKYSSKANEGLYIIKTNAGIVAYQISGSGRVQPLTEIPSNSLSIDIISFRSRQQAGMKVPAGGGILNYLLRKNNYDAFIPVISSIINVSTDDIFGGISNASVYRRNEKMVVNNGTYLSGYTREQYRVIGEIGFSVNFAIQVVIMSEYYRRDN
ncbi:MAG: RHS repeat-associated core domain-containing protein [Balneolaceae bacterium]|nr:RHS repeat-associated core domain-containing protein [Balneolaceae bacterium]